MPFPLDEKFIARAEDELGARFPESFRKKMMRSNGGCMEVSEDFYELHPFYDSSDRKRIKRTCNSIVHETRTHREQYGLPQNLIVLGDNGGGDLLIYKIQENGKIDPAVYWRDRDTAELVSIADDFSEIDECE